MSLEPRPQSAREDTVAVESRTSLNRTFVPAATGGDWILSCVMLGFCVTAFFFSATFGLRWLAGWIVPSTRVLLAALLAPTFVLFSVSRPINLEIRFGTLQPVFKPIPRALRWGRCVFTLGWVALALYFIPLMGMGLVRRFGLDWHWVDQFFLNLRSSRLAPKTLSATLVLIPMNCGFSLMSAAIIAFGARAVMPQWWIGPMEEPLGFWLRLLGIRKRKPRE